MYRKGDYIQREGEIPEGLMLIKEGCAVVCTDKLSMRRLEHSQNRNSKTFSDKEIEKWKRHPQAYQKYKNHRIFQNKEMYLDDDGNVIPDDIIVYKDLMIFSKL